MPGRPGVTYNTRLVAVFLIVEKPQFSLNKTTKFLFCKIDQFDPNKTTKIRTHDDDDLTLDARHFLSQKLAIGILFATDFNPQYLEL
jgi:hypothetical protein